MSSALLRIVYASRAPAAVDAATRAEDLRAILEVARVRNAERCITGLLIVANGHFLQVLEGAADAVQAVYESIGRDTRHGDVTLLSRVEIEARSFGDWAMGLVERAEPEAATTARLELLRARLADDTEASAADFCRLILAPSVSPPPAVRLQARRRRELVSSVAFASPTGLWSAGMLQHVASAAMLRTGRTTVVDPADPSQRTLIEYVDVETPEVGPLRALSLAAKPGSFAALAPLMERLSLLVFMMASSDTEGFIAYVQAWLALPQVIEAAPQVLVLAGLPPQRVVPMLEALRAGTPLTVGFASVKLSDSAAVWQAAQWPLRGQIAIQRSAVRRPLQAAVSRYEVADDDQAAVPAVASRREAETPFPVQTPASASAAASTDLPANEAIAEMVAETGCLQELLGLDGAIGAAVIDAERRVTLRRSVRHDAEPWPTGDHAEFLRVKWQLSKSLGVDQSIEDIAVTTRSRVSIYRSLPRHPELFLALTFDRELGQLALARMRLQEIVGALALLPI